MFRYIGNTFSRAHGLHFLSVWRLPKRQTLALRERSEGAFANHRLSEKLLCSNAISTWTGHRFSSIIDPARGPLNVFAAVRICNLCAREFLLPMCPEHTLFSVIPSG